MRKTALLLGLCQLLFMSAAAVGISFNGLVGTSLAPSPAFATFPFLFGTASTALLTLALPGWFARLGYRTGFALGIGCGMLGGLLCAFAVWMQSFWWFCVACLFVGGYQASALYYRFAAADTVAGPEKSTAIAWVLSGGIIAALIGPWLGSYGLQLFSVDYLGSYLLTALLALLALPVLLFMQLPSRKLPDLSLPPVLLKTVLQHPVFLPAVLFCAGGYGMMMFVMLASPLALTHSGHSPGDAASVIQWHLLGMFAPSLLTGRAIGRFGAQPVALIGCLVLACGCVLALTGDALWLFHVALLAVGVGWNLMYMGGSTLISLVSDDPVRARMQSLTEFTTYGVMTLTAGATGWFYHQLGWSSVLGTTLGLLVAVMLMTMLRQREPALL